MSWGRVVAVSCLIGIIASSAYFAYHEPGALETEMEAEYGWTPAELGLLFTAYSIPPFWMTCVAGILISNYGLKAVGAMLLTFVASGTLVGALASSSSLSGTGKLYVWFFGRLLVGAGSEALVTWQQAACTIWFHGEHLGKAMATALSVQQVVGSAFSFLVLPAFSSLAEAVWATVVFCTGCLACLGLYAVVERAHRPYLDERAAACSHGDDIYEAFGEEDSPRSGTWSIVRAMPALFWAQNVLIFLDVTVLYASANFFPAWLQEVYGMSVHEAGVCTSLIYWMVALAPLAGAVTDRYGYRLVVQTVASLAIGTGFLILYVVPPNLLSPWLALVLIGTLFSCIEYNAYCLLEVTWSGVPGNPEGIGFGIMGIALNLGLVSLPELTGVLATVTGTTRHQNLLFALWMFAGAGISLLERCLPGGQRLNDTAEVLVPIPHVVSIRSISSGHFSRRKLLGSASYESPVGTPRSLSASLLEGLAVYETKLEF